MTPPLRGGASHPPAPTPTPRTPASLRGSREPIPRRPFILCRSSCEIRVQDSAKVSRRICGQSKVVSTRSGGQNSPMAVSQGPRGGSYITQQCWLNPAERQVGDRQRDGGQCRRLPKPRIMSKPRALPSPPHAHHNPPFGTAICCCWHSVSAEIHRPAKSNQAITIYEAPSVCYSLGHLHFGPLIYKTRLVTMSIF